jgi:hypothetical protein
MATFLAPDDQPHTGRSGSAKRHRRAGPGLDFITPDQRAVFDRLFWERLYPYPNRGEFVLDLAAPAKRTLPRCGNKVPLDECVPFRASFRVPVFD